MSVPKFSRDEFFSLFRLAGLEGASAKIRNANGDKSMDETQILKALERRPLTVENLAHTLGCSIDAMREQVQRLWTRGYIEPTHTESQDPMVMGRWLLAQLVPLQRHKRPQCVTSTSQIYFLLTFKGHLHLHPILSFRASQ